MEINKKIREEQIIESVDKAISQQIEENLYAFLINNIKECSEKLKEEKILSQYAIELATMSTAIQMSSHIIKEALIELFCED